MDSFVMNGQLWHVQFVEPYNELLRDRTGHITVATTDPKTHTMCLSNTLYGNFLHRVVIHELGHCAMVSFGLLDDIHRMVRPQYWIEAEEWICNFIADYGMQIFTAAYEILGSDAWLYMPQELERFIA